MSARGATTARLLSWGAMLALLCLVGAARLDWHQPIDTDLLSLLPAQQQSPLLAAATQRSRDTFAREILAEVSGPEADDTRAAAEDAQEALRSGGLEPNTSGARVETLLGLYQQHRFSLLTDEDRARLQKEPIKSLTAEVAGQLANPGGMLGPLASDTGGYLGRFLTTLPQPYPSFLPDGDLFSRQQDGATDFLLRASQSASAFGEEGAERAAKAVEAAHYAVISRCPQCAFVATGAALFADTARKDAQQEIFWLTTVSTVFIMLVIMWVFGSLRPHVLGALCMAASVLAAAAATAAFFGRIHLLTLVAGTTLLGIAIDYAFLYFAAHWFGERGKERTLDSVLPGLTLGLVTALIAFSFLPLSGFPALSQIAVFSDAGLLAAYLTVVLLYPVFLRGHRAKPWREVLNLPCRFVAYARRPTRARLLVPLALLLLAVPGWLRLQTSDDVRALQHLPPQLVAEDALIRQDLGVEQPPGFFLTEGKDLGDALQRETLLFKDLNASYPDRTAIGLSDFLPSPATQETNRAAWAGVLRQPAVLERSLAQLGLPDKYSHDMEAAWKASPAAPLTTDALLAAEPALKQFIVEHGGKLALLSTLPVSEEDVGKLESAASKYPGVQFVAPLDRLAERFRQIRLLSTWLVVAGYGLISLLLLIRYGRHDALRMLYPPLLSLGLTLGLLGWLGEPVNIFVVVGLILVLGIGRDYTVFLKEGGERDRATALAVSLSAMTTLCSFGLLVLSRIPALHAFGLATLIGILVSYLSAPLSLPPSRKGEP